MSYILKSFGKTVDEIKNILELNEIEYIDLIPFHFLDVKIILDNNDCLKRTIEVLYKSIYAADDVTIFEQTAQYLLLHQKTLILFEQGSNGIMASKFLETKGMERLIQKSLNIPDPINWNSAFDIDISFLKKKNAVSNDNIYRIITYLASKNVADFMIADIAVLEESEDYTIKYIQPSGLSYIGIFDETGTTIQKYSFTGNRIDITMQNAMMMCYLILDKLR